MDVLTKEQRRKNMQAIRSTGTKHEVILAKKLWSLGYRYRKNVSKVFGKPDLVLSKYKLAIFIDSEFFHGKDWDSEKFRIKSNRDFWWPKIERNMARDKVVNERLNNEGWKVLRFWSSEISKNLPHCIHRIELELNNEHIQSRKI